LQLTPYESNYEPKESTLAYHGVCDFRRALEKISHFSEQKWIFSDSEDKNAFLTIKYVSTISLL
jgi:hypothetical protein